jgi:glycosyltransferase involved in cell wall biosynthesis
MKKNILLAIPCFNCLKQISNLIDELENKILKNISQILILDNCSSDGTLDTILEKIKNRKDLNKFIIAQNYSNYGLGGSHKSIFNYSIKENFSHTIILHGDKQAKTSELLKFIDIIENLDSDLDAILGSRFMLGSKLIGYSKLRTFGNICLNLIYSFYLFNFISDLGSGLNLYNNKMLKKINYLKFDDQFTFNMDLLLSMIKNFKTKYIPITWIEEDQVSNAKTFQVGWLTLKKLFYRNYLVSKKQYIFKKLEIS